MPSKKSPAKGSTKKAVAVKVRKPRTERKFPALNAKFLGLLKTIGGSERIISIEQAIEELSESAARINGAKAVSSSATIPPSGLTESITPAEDFAKICFYITPIGDGASEQRRHADFLMEYIIKPAVAEFGLTVMRADQMGKPGMIGKQVSTS